MKSRNSYQYAVISFSTICGMIYGAIKSYEDFEPRCMQILCTLLDGVFVAISVAIFTFVLEFFVTYVLDKDFKWKADWHPWAFVVGVIALILCIVPLDIQRKECVECEKVLANASSYIVHDGKMYCLQCGEQAVYEDDGYNFYTQNWE